MKRILVVANKNKNIPEKAIDDVLKRITDSGADAHLCDKISDGVELDKTDLIITLGGDGTIIEAARATSGLFIPIFGINYGKVGYMADAESGEDELVESVIKGECRIENRMTLDVSVMRNGMPLEKEYNALNDVVLSNGPVPKLVSFELHCNDSLAQNIRSDGIVIATPTGSSAYSMSAGGPVVDPEMRCIIATPICPHSLHIRPVVFQGDAVLEIKNAKSSQNKIFLSIDGREIIEIDKEDVITIKKSSIEIPLVRVKNQGFLKVLYTKLSDKES